jgi:KUP system potassium uptake protein
MRRGEQSIATVLAEHRETVRVPGTAVFLFKDLGKAPPALLNNLLHNKVLHASTLVVAVETSDRPRVPPEERAEVTPVGDGVIQVELRFGYMEAPDVPAALREAPLPGVDLDHDDVSYFVGRESVLSTSIPGMPAPLEKLYSLLHRGADSASRFFCLPAERVFEVGTQVEI